MRAPAQDEAPLEVPFEPPTPRLVHRTIHAADSETAKRRSAVLRGRMLAQGIRLIAVSSRTTSDGVSIELVFSPRT
jgi:hypothetical protein